MGKEIGVLGQMDLLKPERKPNKKEKADVTVTLTKNGKESMRYAICIRHGKDKAFKKALAFKREANCLIFFDVDDGFKICDRDTAGVRVYIQRRAETNLMDDFLGNYELKKDEYTGHYYITNN